MAPLTQELTVLPGVRVPHCAVAGERVVVVDRRVALIADRDLQAITLGDVT